MRVVDDKDYIDYLGTSIYAKHYLRWKEKFSVLVETLAEELNTHSVEELTEKYNMCPRDWTLLVAFKYFTQEEIDKFGLAPLEFLVKI